MRNRPRRRSVYGAAGGEEGSDLNNESDWPALLKDYQAAVNNFASVSAAMTDALSAQYPLGIEFLDLIEAEGRVRDAVILTRIRLINLWRDSLDETKPLPFVGSPDRSDAG